MSLSSVIFLSTEFRQQLSGGRPRYFTVSETLQAVFDESDDHRDDELWADDDVSLEQTPCTSSTAIYSALASNSNVGFTRFRVS